MTPNQFKTKMRPYAEQVASALGVDKSFAETVLNQWGLESGWGTSAHASRNNYGGIKYSKYSKTAVAHSSGFAQYKSLQDFATDYVRVLKLDYYKGVLVAAKTPSLVDDAQALGQSPYDAGHYILNGVQGGKLLNMLGMTAGGGGSAVVPKSTAGMSADQVQSWATVGLAVVAAIAGIKVVQAAID